MGARRRLAAITGSKLYKVIASVGKHATRWRECGDECFAMSFNASFRVTNYLDYNARTHTV